MAVGFVTVWSQIRSQSRTAKQDTELAKIDLEKRIRDYLDLRLTNMQMSVDHLRESLTRVERKLNRQQQQREEDG
jgi:prefoldin subunit 5